MHVSDGGALIEAPAYRFDLVLFAYRHLVDLLTERISGGVSSAISGRKGGPGPFIWPEPGRQQIVGMWERHAALYGATGERVRHGFREGPVICAAYILGREWLVQHPETLEVRTNHGAPAHQLDTMPGMEFYEAELPGGIRRGLLQSSLDRLVGVLREDIERLRLKLTITQAQYASEPRAMLTLRFPHDIYGAGRQWMRVVCNAPDGTNAKEQTTKN